jgi:drug/metabolite transporter (DMT)-like permease
MNWIFLTVLGPFLYALTNHIDKHLLERQFKQGGVGTLMLFSSFLAAFALPILYWINPAVLSVSARHIAVLVAVGILNTLVLLFYLMALDGEEASVAIVFYQLVPVLGLILGYVILGETISRLQFVAMAIVILGTTIISFEIDAENRFKLRRQTIIYMLAASFCWALGSVIFKAVAIEEDVWRSLFWEHLTLAAAGVFMFACIGSYRGNFLAALTHNTRRIVSLNVLNEALYMCGNIIFSYSYVRAPISLVLLVDSFQPIFVLAIGVFLTVFFPHIAEEKIHAKHLWQRFLAICITGVGTYLLFVS